MIEKIVCPSCGCITELYKNPCPTVDVIVDMGGKIVLINRKNPPYGWAIPGGFIEYGESAEDAAAREIKEETSLDITDLAQFHVYSDPGRDPRFHTITIVFTAQGRGTPSAGDDAAGLGIFGEEELPSPLVFDHARILTDYFRVKKACKEQ
ncbi:MAG: NUDIX hydrolase [Candidatus Latescibacterota bacterium]